MITREQKEALKIFAQRGGFSILTPLLEEIKEENKEIKFEANAEKLVYEVGYKQGVREGMDILLDKINFYISDVA